MSRPCPRCGKSEPEVKFWRHAVHGRQTHCVRCLQDYRHRYVADESPALRDGMSLEEVAIAMNLSKERVRQIEQVALLKLRRNRMVMSMVKKLLEDR